VLRLHRHQLARLAPGGWAAVRAQARDEMEQACLGHWADAGLPLVITQQRCSSHADAPVIAMGVSAPLRWERRRIGVQVPRAEVLYFDEFPTGLQVAGLLPVRARSAWERLCTALRAAGATPRVYGSYGWQFLSGAGHLHSRSDLDLWLPVTDPQQADEIAALLNGFEAEGLRLDGELLFCGDNAVSWREWTAWRAGRSRAVLVKTMSGSRLLRTLDELVGQDLAEALP
jgi:phosphoribosyl-dephospho-CoA transferase